MLLWAVAVTACVSLPLQGAEQSGGTIAAGTKWATPYHVIDSGRDGPTVVITGGVHGNEPAGARAAGQMRWWTITRGKLVIIPRVNALALKAVKRETPGAAKGEGDLNRNFPKEGADKPRGPLAEAIWAFVDKQDPDWLLDLHEGINYRKLTTKSTGASLIRMPSAAADPAAKAMLAAVNATVDEDDHKLVALRGAAKGSLARAAFRRLGAQAMILESCRKDHVWRRARQHRTMVHSLLTRLKMVDGSVDRIMPPTPPAERRQKGIVHIAIYNGPSSSSTAATMQGACRSDGVLVELVGPPEIRAGVLAEQFDVVIFPGGSGSGQARAIGEDGSDRVREFVRGGGGFLGVCAGAYLATSEYTWGLRILDARTVDRKHWKRGTGNVKVELTPEGREIFGGEAKLDVRYANGPLLGPFEMDELDDYTTLAHFRTEIRKNDAPKGVMLNSPAMIAGECDRGRVIACSPHPEKNESLHYIVHRAIRWLARRPLTGSGKATGQ